MFEKCVERRFAAERHKWCGYSLNTQPETIRIQHRPVIRVFQRQTLESTLHLTSFSNSALFGRLIELLFPFPQAELLDRNFYQIKS